MLHRHGRRRYMPEQRACIRRCTKNLVCVGQEDVLAALLIRKSKRNTVSQIDGCTDDLDILQIFTTKYDSLYNSLV